ncbi:MAG: DinB family protein, partial [Anaerolineales bacterium]|nr:DinB family protein [Anaerolineales bacterium]
GSLRETMLHIVDGEYGWRGLFEQNTFLDLNWDDFPNFASLEKKFHEEEKSMRAYLNRLTDEDMESHLRYTVEGGIKRNRILWHCLYHLVNHGTQHRSEAAAILTSYDVSPGDIDFTLFLNQYAKEK